MNPDLPGFHFDPWWLILLKTVGIFGFLVVTVLVTIWAERRLVGFMQQRPGPNRAGPFGLLQSLADGIKLAFKEDLTPAVADKAIFFLAPIISVIPAFVAWSVIPLGPEVSIFGETTALQLTDMPVAVLVILATSSLGVYGLVLGGWSSGSPYPLLGGLRSSAQVISYEIALALALASVFLLAGTLSTSGIVAAQHTSTWFAVGALPAMIIYGISAVGETNRAPFDLPEAEGELVGGFHTEYSSLKFAMFFLAEYVNMTTVAALGVTCFLGGWAPPPIPGIAGLTGWWGLLWFALKVWVILFIFVWLRGSLPRMRYDQFMRLGWRWLVPLALVWLMAVAGYRLWDNTADLTLTQQLLWLGVGFAVLVLLSTFVPVKDESDEERAPDDDGLPPAFPVPSLADVTAERPPSPALAGAARTIDAPAVRATEEDANG